MYWLQDKSNYLYFIVAFDILYQPMYDHVYLIWLVCLFDDV
jgi:hypothetical protein